MKLLEKEAGFLIAYEGSKEGSIKEFEIFEDLPNISQSSLWKEEDLGKRMEKSIEEGFKRDYKKVIFLGSNVSWTNCCSF